jgi:hypothetical protein
MASEQSLVERLRTRARIRREIRGRVMESKRALGEELVVGPMPDRIADLCDEAADEISRLKTENSYLQSYVQY